MCAQPYTAFSGVRSSCESTARNSSFARLAASAAARARCSFSSSRALSMAMASWAATPAMIGSRRSGNIAGFSWPRKSPPMHLAGAGHDRHREVARHRQVAPAASRECGAFRP